MSKLRLMTERERLQFAGVLVVLLLAALVACSACGARPGGVAMPTQSDPAIARMMSPKGNFQCTAWKVGDNFVMTAGHCCEVDETYTMEGKYASPGEIYEVLVDDDEHDVCVLSGHLDGDSIKIAGRDPVVGAPVWTEGWPHDILLISSGYWSGRTDGDGICSSTVGFGSSGSPVLDSNNRAIGLISRRFMDMDNLTIVSTVEWMRRALEKARIVDSPAEIVGPNY